MRVIVIVKFVTILTIGALSSISTTGCAVTSLSEAITISPAEANSESPFSKLPNSESGDTEQNSSEDNESFVQLHRIEFHRAAISIYFIDSRTDLLSGTYSTPFFPPKLLVG